MTRDEIIVAFGHGHGSSPFLNTAYRLNVTAAAETNCRGSGPDCEKTTQSHNTGASCQTRQLVDDKTLHQR